MQYSYTSVEISIIPMMQQLGLLPGMDFLATMRLHSEMTLSQLPVRILQPVRG